MITNQELNINNKSYINKDFASIYPELVDLVQKLTARWDPSTSNESDPGVVLLKLMAFIADKDNYNIDKNILERFPLSATQESSMRQLCDMLGYAMGYYKAAETEVSLTYTGDTAVSLPALTTVLTNDDNTLNFVLKNSAQLLKNQTTKVNVIQGDLKTLSISNSETILLENIDDNNRVYFPETLVAENGVFISGGTGNVIDNTNDGYWTKVDNLNLQILGYKVFRFGYDSFEGLPYIEFPEDIATLIGNGLTIQYLVTDGLNGNVAAKSITKLLSPTTISDSSGNVISFEGDNNGGILIIKNASASINGSDPETIDDAYNGYKRTVGTFDTYVTVRDYANAIYNLYDSLDSPVVSNVQVSDRRDDVNYSSQIITYDNQGVYNKTVHNDNINAFDLLLYPLSPISSYTQEGYVKSFKPLSNTSNIIDALEESQTISHNYKDLNDDDLYLLKNYLTLNANISTKNKVNVYERLDIINNIKTALYKKFNAREVDYGYEIPFDSLLETIENADERIKSVSLAEPTLKTTYMTKDANELNLLSDSNNYLKVLAKNILAGRISLFNKNTDFLYALGQKQVNSKQDMIIPRIKCLKTSFSPTFEANKLTTRTLKDNEIIQLVAPNLLTEITYPYAVNYCWVSNTNFPANIDKKILTSSDKLLINYTDSDDVEHLYIYSQNSIDSYIIKDDKAIPGSKTTTDNVTNIFKSSFEIPTESSKSWKDNSGTTTATKIINVEGISYHFLSIGTNDTIEKRKINEVTLSDGTPCYWVVNNINNNNHYEIPWEGTNEDYYMLQDGEYFFYTDSGYNDIVSLGSGTILYKKGAQLTTASKWECEQVALVDILESGVSALKNYWLYLKNNISNAADKFTIRETQILTLTSGDIINFTPSDNINLDNNLYSIPDGSEISYQIFGSDLETLTMLEIGDKDYNWKIKSRLDINAGPQLVQTIDDDQNVTVYYYKTYNDGTYSDESCVKLAKDSKFYLNKTLQLVGSDNINLVESEIISKAPYTKLVYNTKLYYFEQDTSTLQNPSGYSSLTITKGNNYSYVVPNLGSEKELLMMLYWNGQNDELQIKYSDCQISRYNYPSSIKNNIYNIPSGMSIIKFSDISTNAKIIISTTDSYADASKYNLIISKLTVSDGFNPDLNLKLLAQTTEKNETDLENALLVKLQDYDINSIFYYNNDIDNSKAITFTDEDCMMSPYIFYDYNNVYNKFTLSEIDFENSYIDVIRSSRS